MNPALSAPRGALRRPGPRILSALLLSAALAAPTSAETYTWGTLTGSSGSPLTFRVPVGLAVGTGGNLLVDEWYSSGIYLVSPGGVSTRLGIVLPPQAGLATGMTATADGTVYLVCNFSVLRITPDNETTTLATLWSNGGRIYEYPQGIAVDDAGTVYVTDSDRANIQTISPGGTVAVLAGSQGRFTFPSGIVVDPVRNVYVADLGAGTISRITPDGVCTVVAGRQGERGATDGPGGLARFAYPTSLALDRVGNLYVADSYWQVDTPPSHTVRKISPAGLVTTIGGKAGMPGNADGPGETARFNLPFGLAVDAAGNVYVGEEGSHTIRKGVPDPAPDPEALAVRSSSGPGEAPPGAMVSFTATAAGRAPFSYQWMHNGRPIVGATAPAYLLGHVGAATAGLYSVRVTDARGSLTSAPAILGTRLASGVQGSATEVNANVMQPCGNVCDQVLLTGAAAAVRADTGQVVRLSYIDLSDDIVQVEFSGAGTLTLTLDNPSGPAAPALYNQAVGYLRGHARIVVSGANETTNLSVFSVGRITAVNQGLFREAVAYDGRADLASVAIVSANGKFGGLRLANATCFAADGLAGLYAPAVQFQGPVYLGDINAADAARPVLMVGSAGDVRITGGDLLQDNGQPVEVCGLSRLQFTAGQTSHGALLPAQPIRARLTQGGVDITSLLVAAASP